MQFLCAPPCLRHTLQITGDKQRHAGLQTADLTLSRTAGQAHRSGMEKYA